MHVPDSDYRGLVASTWDLWRDNTADWSDRHYYLQIIREFGQPVLDIGCGTGRLVIDFLQHEIDIDGIDPSGDMLDICRNKAKALGLSPRLELQRIEHLRMPRRYRTILLASSVIQLISPADARTGMRRCFEHLEAGGAVTGSFAFGWRDGDPLDTGWTLLFEKPRRADGAIVRSWTHEWHDPLPQQTWHAEQRFEVVAADGKVLAQDQYRRSPEGWWYTQAQAEALYRDAGFTPVELYRGFDRTPATIDDRLFTVLGVKP